MEISSGPERIVPADVTRQLVPLRTRALPLAEKRTAHRNGSPVLYSGAALDPGSGSK